MQAPVFRAKYRARFLQLADIFLSSGMVPAYTAAAFIKKFARLALTAPPAGLPFPSSCGLRPQSPNDRLLVWLLTRCLYWEFVCSAPTALPAGLCCCLLCPGDSTDNVHWDHVRSTQLLPKCNKCELAGNSCYASALPPCCVFLGKQDVKSTFVRSYLRSTLCICSTVPSAWVLRKLESVGLRVGLMLQVQ